MIDGAISAIDVDFDKLRQTMETNVYGPFRLIQVILPLMRNDQSGRIINISSSMGLLHSMGGGHPSYRMSKTAMNSLTGMVAAELRHTNIKVNAMCPGWVQTDMGGAGAPGTVESGADTAVWLATASNIPSGKFFRNRKVQSW